MGKRKSVVPQRADESKRQLMTWNLADLNHDIVVVNDDDPSIQQNKEQAEKLLSEVRGSMHLLEPDSGAVCLDGEENETKGSSDVQALIDECEFYLTVQDSLKVKPNEWTAKLGTIRLKLYPSHGPTHRLSRGLPDVPEFWLYVNEDNNTRHLVYYELEENSDDVAGTSKDSPQVCHV